MFLSLLTNKYVIIGIVILLLLGVFGIQQYRIKSLKADLVVANQEIGRLTEENKRIVGINNTNSEQCDRQIAALNKLIKEKERICAEKVKNYQDQLRLCQETKCIDADPTDNTVKILDDVSSQKHIVFYNNLLKELKVD